MEKLTLDTEYSVELSRKIGILFWWERKTIVQVVGTLCSLHSIMMSKKGKSPNKQKLIDYINSIGINKYREIDAVDWEVFVHSTYGRYVNLAKRIGVPTHTVHSFNVGLRTTQRRSKGYVDKIITYLKENHPEICCAQQQEEKHTSASRPAILAVYRLNGIKFEYQGYDKEHILFGDGSLLRLSESSFNRLFRKIPNKET